MEKRGFTSITEQVAQSIRCGVRQGRWRETVPGRNRLAVELGVNHKTVTAALDILEAEGVLESQGPGRERRIVDVGKLDPAPLRVAILLYEESDRDTGYLLALLHRLQDAGYDASYMPRTMRELGMDVARIARVVRRAEADAWVVVAGSREVLEWFAEQPTPALALFGRSVGVPIASSAPQKWEALTELVERLVKLRHRRIILLVREERRKPTPGFLERCFLEELEGHGIPTGSYNLPDWKDTPEGLQRFLDSLFRHTPPTALLLDEPSLFIAARDHLARKGIHAPEHVSLVCCDADSTFHWCRPTIAHIAWDSRPVINRVVRWTKNISHRKDDRRKVFTKARLILGGTLGPAPKDR
ncbi:substrate-binding domain-containing protein [Haloferula sp. A504]|uniref:substrate-binding domain-containing protein n=1 Tax=Haloferula sp. A504 TaxID=3373601 RepID=UPI0031C6BF8F|nr:substrate-binding domain-containing protein [Verrucomicrobiaceae bacterium E54]